MFLMKMLLSLIIETHPAEYFPNAGVFRIIKPVFAEHWQNIIINDGVHPLICTNIPAAEIAVSNAESLTQRFIKCNFMIQVFYLGY